MDVVVVVWGAVVIVVVKVATGDAEIAPEVVVVEVEVLASALEGDLAIAKVDGGILEVC